MKMRVFLKILLGVCAVVAIASVFMTLGAILGIVGAWKVAIYAAVAAGLLVVGCLGADKSPVQRKKAANTNTNGTNSTNGTDGTNR